MDKQYVVTLYCAEDIDTNEHVVWVNSGWIIERTDKFIRFENTLGEIFEIPVDYPHYLIGDAVELNVNL